MENIKVGDILIDRDTRRVGRKLKVIWVDADSVTAEVISDSLNSKKSSVGNSTDIKRSRLKKGYTLADSDKIDSLDLGKMGVGTISPDRINFTSADVGFTSNDLNPNDLMNDTNDLEDALNSAGYFWLPPVSDLADAVLEESGNISKSGLVHLIHATIKQGLVSGN